jgi:hypothetical protein
LNNLPESIKKKLYIVHCSGIPEYVETETSEGNKLRVKVTHLKRPQTEETVRVWCVVPRAVCGVCVVSRLGVR